MKLKTRVWILISAAMIGMLVVATVSLVTLRNTMMSERKEQLSTLVALAHASLERAYEKEKSGKLSVTDAQREAKEAVAALHKDDKYFFVRDFANDINLVHPNSKRVGIIDPDGKTKGDEYRNALAQSSQPVGYVLSEGTRPNTTGKVPKLYAVIKFEPWNWIVGYGIYVDDINTTFQDRALTYLLIGGLLMVLVAALALRMSRMILGQLGGEPDYAADIAMDISTGNLSRNIVVTGSKESLLGSMCLMLEGLRRMVTSFNKVAQQLAESAGTMTEQMKKISSGSHMTSEATSSTAAAVEEMAVSSAHISAIARETESNSKKASELATHGEQLAVKATDGIRQIADEVSGAADLIRTLVVRSREIDSMSAVIKEIADQTNLLALNAAIEAARAGEQGRGFAVVADEVRKLAERTSGATQDITKTIRAVQNDTNLAAERMDEVLDRVESGVTLVEKAADALREINIGACGTLEKARDVANAAIEQSQANNSIAANIERIAQMVEEADAAVQLAHGQVQQLNGLAGDLHREAGNFRL
ncbi:MAG: methyl-accepting chemotaxis protein [Betaproteobacteria bacterium]